MNKRRHFNLRAKRMAFLLSALGLTCLPIRAQEVTKAQDDSVHTRGKMIDRSRTLDVPVGSSTERQSHAYDDLSASSLSTADRSAMLAAAAPATPSQSTLTLEDKVDGSHFESGKAVLLPNTVAVLNGLLQTLQGKTGVRMEIIGHTDDQRISQALRATYPDNQALSQARALAVAAYLKQHLNASADAFAVSGRGQTQPVASNATPAGMAKNRRVEIHVWFNETVAVAPKPVSTNACVANPVAADLPFSISIDGQPVDLNAKAQEADHQRCVDVALEKADIQIKYDPLNVVPALNVWVATSTAVRGKPMFFGSYTNYAWWQKRAELRVFIKGQNNQETPLAVVPVAPGGAVLWQAPDNAPSELAYLMRVYDADGHFDETLLKPLRMLDRGDPLVDARRMDREKLSGWGESSLHLKNIPARGGAVTISGENVKPGENVSAMGMQIPVDDKGKFVMRQILPAGPHQVAVSVRDAAGKGASFTRNLTIADKDWFYVAMADVTMGRDHTSGPAPLVTTDLQHYNNQTWVDGRGAFYLKGKVKGDYLLTASADTREQPLENLFSNFQSKDPYYLLRRIDPDIYYPVYGDDSTIADDAPTQGKFYVKLEKDGSSVMWGNFQTAWTGTELTQYSRGLYGANLVWNDNGTTQFGEKVTSINAFVADPGTLQSREEFRGTGGSLYYLHHIDTTEGSERLWIEVRDKDSGLAIQRTPLTPAQDYEIDYLQGRVTLRAPLPSVSDGSTLVQTSSANGNPVYMVATYEYVPGLTQVSGTSIGVRASHWINDSLRVGTTLYRQGDSGQDQTLKGVDATYRYKPGTWFKTELAQSSGIGATALTSQTGGYDFAQSLITSQTANAERFDAAVDLADISAIKGRLGAYWQKRGAGFSGPGLATANGEAMEQKGLVATVPITDTTELSGKVDDRSVTSQSANSVEGAVRHKIDAEWGVSAGVRRDQRSTANTGVLVNASPLLSQNGSRSDVIVRVDYRPLEPGQEEKLAQLQAGAAIDYGSAVPATMVQSSSTTGTSAPVSVPVTTSVGNGLLGDTQSGPASSLVPTTGMSNGASTRSAIDATSAVGVAAARVPGLKYKAWDTYGFVQGTVAKTGDRSENDRGGIGGSWQVNDKLRLGAEASGGSGGVGGRLSSDYAVDDRSTVYLSYTMETESQDNNYGGRQGTLTSGSRYRYSDQVGVFGETRWSAGEGPKSLTHAFGVDFAPDAHWTTGVKYETGTLSDPVSGDLKRNAIGLTAAYKFNDLKFTSQLEYRTDKSTTLGNVAGTCITADLNGNCAGIAGSGDRRTWLWKNSAQYQLSQPWRLLGKFNLSRSQDTQGAFYDGDYTEAVLGAAYRPVDNDRWNTLFKYTYFYNLPSPGQVDSVSGSALDYTQKSHVLNIDTTYDVVQWLSVGAKYGMRLGQLRLSKTAGDWFSSRADLMVVRADLHFVKEWDAMLEARRLRVQEASDARAGYLVAVYRHVADHMKVGVGYNFTDFSDDLTNMSYKSRGWFINALATF